MKTQGYDPGPLDGIWSRSTLAAVQDFQTRRGLNPDGIVTPDLEQLIVTSTRSTPSNGMV